MKLSGTGLEWNCAEWKDYFGGNCLVSDKTLGWNYLRRNNWGGIVGGRIVRGGVVQDGVVWGGISRVELSGVELSRVELFGLRRNSRVELFAWK